MTFLPPYMLHRDGLARDVRQGRRGQVEGREENTARRWSGVESGKGGEGEVE